MGIHRPMDLNFGVLETAVLFLCILKSGNIVIKKEATGFEGSTLVGGYVAIAIAFWFWVKEGTPDEVGAMVESTAEAVAAITAADSSAAAKNAAKNAAAAAVKHAAAASGKLVWH